LGRDLMTECKLKAAGIWRRKSHLALMAVEGKSMALATLNGCL